MKVYLFNYAFEHSLNTLLKKLNEVEISGVAAYLCKPIRKATFGFLQLFHMAYFPLIVATSATRRMREWEKQRRWARTRRRERMGGEERDVSRLTHTSVFKSGSHYIPPFAPSRGMHFLFVEEKYCWRGFKILWRSFLFPYLLLPFLG